MKDRPYFTFATAELAALVDKNWNRAEALWAIRKELAFRSRRTAVVLKADVDAQLRRLSAKRKAADLKKLKPKTATTGKATQPVRTRASAKRSKRSRADKILARVLEE